MASEIDHYRKLLEYDEWANRAHHESLVQVSDKSREEFQAALYAFNHVVAAVEIWYCRARSIVQESVDFTPSLSLGECKLKLEEGTKLWKEYLANGSTADLDRAVTYRDTFDNEYTMTLRDIISHMMLHSAHHRGQTAILLRRAGFTPADADYYISPMAQGHKS